MKGDGEGGKKSRGQGGVGGLNEGRMSISIQTISSNEDLYMSNQFPSTQVHTQVGPRTHILPIITFRA